MYRRYLKWKPYCLALMTCLLIFLVTPPQYLYPVQWCAWIPFLMSLENCTDRKQQFYRGWFMGFFLNGLIFHGLAPTVSEYGSYPLWLGYVLVAVYVLFQGIAFGILAVLTVYLRQQYRTVWILGSAAAVSSIEFFWPRVFPWSLGWGQLGSDAIIQWVSIFGAEGMTFWVITANALFYQAWYLKRQKDGRYKNYAIYACVLIAATWVSGSIRMQTIPEKGKSLKVSVLQMDESAKIRKNLDYVTRIIPFIEHTKQSLRENPELIIWPETVLLGSLRGPAWNIFRIESNRWQTPIIVGALIRSQDKYRKNMMLYYDAEGILKGSYTKRRPVPFGERIPFEDWFPWLHRFGRKTWHESGKQAEVFDVNGINIGPLICQDGLYPDPIQDLIKLETDLVLYAANDSWFGRSAVSEAHFMLAKIRALEFGIPVMRAGNTGYTAFIDPYGRVIGKTQLYEKIAWIQSLQIYQVKTPYRWLQPYLPWVLGGGLLFCLIWPRVKPARLS